HRLPVGNRAVAVEYVCEGGSRGNEWRLQLLAPSLLSSSLDNEAGKSFTDGTEQEIATDSTQNEEDEQEIATDSTQNEDEQEIATDSTQNEDEQEIATDSTQNEDEQEIATDSTQNEDEQEIATDSTQNEDEIPQQPEPNPPTTCILHMEKTGKNIGPFKAITDEAWKKLHDVKATRLLKKGSKYVKICESLPEIIPESAGYHTACYKNFTAI
ncbi:unnamed protein product, partial [Cyprideis torosa]